MSGARCLRTEPSPVADSLKWVRKRRRSLRSTAKRTLTRRADAGAEKSRAPDGARRHPRWTTWAIVAVLWGVFSPQLGAALLPPDTLRDFVAERFDEDPSHSDRIVDTYVRVARNATAWERPPTVHASSVGYFKKHFATLDPDRHHPFPDVRKLLLAPVADLAVASPVFVGTPVLISGFVYGAPTVVTPARVRGTLSWAFAIRDPDVKDAVVLARIPIRGAHDLGHGDRVSVAGLVLADGAARYTGRGLTRVVYVAGSSIAPSTRLTLKFSRRRP